jgi:hypothetical protein
VSALYGPIIPLMKVRMLLFETCVYTPNFSGFAQSLPKLVMPVKPQSWSHWSTGLRSRPGKYLCHRLRGQHRSFCSLLRPSKSPHRCSQQWRRVVPSLAGVQSGTVAMTWYPPSQSQAVSSRQADRNSRLKPTECLRRWSTTATPLHQSREYLGPSWDGL